MIPIEIKNFIRSRITSALTLPSYYNDYRRFKKASFTKKNHMNQNQLKACITKEYHSIEKGLSNISFRIGFGQVNLPKLVDSLLIYYDKGYDKSHTAFITGLAVINAYIERHASMNNLDSELKSFLKSIELKINHIQYNLKGSIRGGMLEISKTFLLKKSISNFGELALNRYSIRDYSKESVDISIINNALEISSKTPSVCNRQDWHSLVISDKDLIRNVLSIQKGLTGQGSNISYLLVICADNNNFVDYKERNQGFIDGGMFSMSLIYSLTALGVATCPLNANLSIRDEKKVRKLLSLKQNLSLIMFISVGHYLEINRVPVSQRYRLSELVTFL